MRVAKQCYRKKKKKKKSSLLPDCDDFPSSLSLWFLVYQSVRCTFCLGARCNGRVFTHGAMGCRIDPSW